MPTVFLGQTLVAVFQPAILNSPGKIAANWFKPSSRTLVTTICCVSNTIGILVGFAFHLPFVNEETRGEEYKNQFFDYLLYEFI